MEEEEKLTEAELREDADSYLNKLRLRSEFAIIIGVPLLLFLCYYEYACCHQLMEMILFGIPCVLVALANIMRCRTIKSIDFQNDSLQEIANRMKVLKKREEIIVRMILVCLLAWPVLIAFRGSSSAFKSCIAGVLGAFVIFVAYKLFLRSRNRSGNDYDDMISQLENYRQTDL